jgi:hypothetical protein
MFITETFQTGFAQTLKKQIQSILKQLLPTFLFNLFEHHCPIFNQKWLVIKKIYSLINRVVSIFPEVLSI